MAEHFMHTVLTPSVLEMEKTYYGKTYPTESEPPPADSLTEDEVAMIQSRDSFYMATITETGWPYIQHRGGPPGFLKVIEPNRIGFADYSGNRQMISTGSLAKMDRVSLFLMDYPHRTRLKILGHAQVLEAKKNPALTDQLAPPDGHAASPERLFLIDVVGYDWNCPKFIIPRFTQADVERVVAPLNERIKQLEASLKQYGSS